MNTVIWTDTVVICFGRQDRCSSSERIKTIHMSHSCKMPRARSVGRWRPAAAEAGYSLIELLVVVGLVAIVSAMAVPMTSNTLATFRLSGDARGVVGALSLAKLRAASDFTRARLYVDITGRTFRVETWQKTAATWTAIAGSRTLASNDNFGFGVVAAAPANTQAVLGQSPACLDDMGNAVANTACILFNSRGIPIDTAGAPMGNHAIYLTDGSAVYGVTLSATGLTRLWLTRAAAAPVWQLQ
jgi:prepilin-type N-terminal cleavage/methylation domain-containing protein